MSNSQQDTTSPYFQEIIDRITTALIESRKLAHKRAKFAEAYSKLEKLEVSEARTFPEIIDKVSKALIASSKLARLRAELTGTPFVVGDIDSLPSLKEKNSPLPRRFQAEFCVIRAIPKAK